MTTGRAVFIGGKVATSAMTLHSCTPSRRREDTAKTPGSWAWERGNALATGAYRAACPVRFNEPRSTAQAHHQLPCDLSFRDSPSGFQENITDVAANHSDCLALITEKQVEITCNEEPFCRCCRSQLPEFCLVPVRARHQMKVHMPPPRRADYQPAHRPKKRTQ